MRNRIRVRHTAFDKVMSVLLREPVVCTTESIAHETGYALPTVRRTLGNLMEWGYVRKVTRLMPDGSNGYYSTDLRPRFRT